MSVVSKKAVKIKLKNVFTTLQKCIPFSMCLLSKKVAPFKRPLSLRYLDDAISKYIREYII